MDKVCEHEWSGYDGYCGICGLHMSIIFKQLASQNAKYVAALLQIKEALNFYAQKEPACWGNPYLNRAQDALDKIKELEK
jgi:hypothetical protein